MDRNPTRPLILRANCRHWQHSEALSLINIIGAHDGVLQPHMGTLTYRTCPHSHQRHSIAASILPQTSFGKFEARSRLAASSSMERMFKTIAADAEANRLQ